MRLVLDARARRWLQRVSRYDPYTVAELVLLSLLAVQCARLVWVIVTPVGPIGDWRPAGSIIETRAPSSAIFGEFDPFFRSSTAPAGPTVVTGLDLKLFGIRADQATGRGSAIIGTPDGRQQSYVVGEEVLPGVVLAAVAFDGVTLRRGGTDEMLYLDQSQPAAAVGGAPAPPPLTNLSGLPSANPQAATPPAPTPAAQAQALLAETRFTPRIEGQTVTGFTVQPQGSGQAFAASGLQAGDIVVSVNGQRVLNAEAAERLRDQLAAGPASVQVERAGRTITLSVGARR